MPPCHRAPDAMEPQVLSRSLPLGHTEGPSLTPEPLVGLAEACVAAALQFKFSVCPLILYSPSPIGYCSQSAPPPKSLACGGEQNLPPQNPFGIRIISGFFLVFVVVVVVFLGPRPWHMEVPRLGVESEL